MILLAEPAARRGVLLSKQREETVCMGGDSRNECNVSWGTRCLVLDSGDRDELREERKRRRCCAYLPSVFSLEYREAELFGGCKPNQLARKAGTSKLTAYRLPQKEFTVV